MIRYVVAVGGWIWDRAMGVNSGTSNRVQVLDTVWWNRVCQSCHVYFEFKVSQLTSDLRAL